MNPLSDENNADDDWDAGEDSDDLQPHIVDLDQAHHLSHVGCGVAARHDLGRTQELLDIRFENGVEGVV